MYRMRVSTETTLGRARRRRKVWRSTCFRASVGLERAGELGARADAELRVDPREVRLDGADADEETRGDLLVRESLGDERSDAALGLVSARRPRPAGGPAAARGRRRPSPPSGPRRARRTPSGPPSAPTAPPDQLRARRSTRPWTCIVLARSNGSGSSSCAASASSSAARAASWSPWAEATSASQRPAIARHHGCPAAGTARSAAATASASSRRPAAAYASPSTCVTGKIDGLPMPASCILAHAGSSMAIAPSASSSASATRPRTPRCEVSYQTSRIASVRASPSRATARAASWSPRSACTYPSGNAAAAPVCAFAAWRACSLAEPGIGERGRPVARPRLDLREVVPSQHLDDLDAPLVGRRDLVSQESGGRVELAGVHACAREREARRVRVRQP